MDLGALPGCVLGWAKPCCGSKAVAAGNPATLQGAAFPLAPVP